MKKLPGCTRFKQALVQLTCVFAKNMCKQRAPTCVGTCNFDTGISTISSLCRMAASDTFSSGLGCSPLSAVLGPSAVDGRFEFPHAQVLSSAAGSELSSSEGSPASCSEEANAPRSTKGSTHRPGMEPGVAGVTYLEPVRQIWHVRPKASCARGLSQPAAGRGRVAVGWSRGRQKQLGTIIVSQIYICPSRSVTT